MCWSSMGLTADGQSCVGRWKSRPVEAAGGQAAVVVDEVVEIGAQAGRRPERSGSRVVGQERRLRATAVEEGEGERGATLRSHQATIERGVRGPEPRHHLRSVAHDRVVQRSPAVLPDDVGIEAAVEEQVEHGIGLVAGGARTGDAGRDQHRLVRRRSAPSQLRAGSLHVRGGEDAGPGLVEHRGSLAVWSPHPRTVCRRGQAPAILRA